MEQENYLSAVIDRLEEEKAILLFDDGQKLIVPIESLPEGAAEGGVLKIFFGSDFSSQTEREKRAKDLLNEILKRND